MNRRRRRNEPSWLEELTAALMLLVVLVGILALGYLIQP